MNKRERLDDCVRRSQKARRKARSLTQVLPAMTTAQAQAALEVERGQPVTEAQVDEAIAIAMDKMRMRRRAKT
jgi:hypothetical protein